MGSTTVKLAILDEANDVKFAVYRRHHADVRATIVEVLEEAAVDFGPERMTIAITGSGGLLLSVAGHRGSCRRSSPRRTAVETFIPKPTWPIPSWAAGTRDHLLRPGHRAAQPDGTCAGSTGAFIDQMAALLNTDAGGLNELAREATTIYPIASRCGVFAKTDVQPLLNEGARKGGHRRVHLPIGGHPDHLRPGVRPPYPRSRGLPRRPLRYLPELRKRSCETLGWTTSIIVPEQQRICSWPAAALSRAQPARR